MNPKISKDLEELAMIVEQHHKNIGLNKDDALKETVSLVRKIGRHFKGCRLYISINESIENKAKAIKKQMDKGCYSVMKISQRTGIPPSTVSRIKKTL